MLRLGVALVAGAVGVAGCAAQEDMAEEGPDEVVLGPTDGHDLEAADLDRVQVGQVAPGLFLRVAGGASGQALGLRGWEERRSRLLPGTLVTVLRQAARGVAGLDDGRAENHH